MKPNKEQLQELSGQVFDIATRHGWHEEKHSAEHYLCLIMTEVAEAVEADRNSRKITDDHKRDYIAVTTDSDGYRTTDTIFIEAYRRYVKGTVDEEFADIVIRILDMAYEIHGDKMDWLGYYPCGCRFRMYMSFPESAWHFTKDVLNCGTMNISNSIMFIFDWAEFLGIDLLWNIQQKMKYNDLRPYKHGGKAY